MPDSPAADEPLRVLYIEDDGLERLAAQRHFENEVPDMSLTAVGSLAAAKDALRAGEFDAIVTDYVLRGESGFAVLELSASLPILFLTGRGDERVAVQALKRGADDYLVKDSHSGHLSILPIVVRNAVRRRRAEEALRLVRFQNSVAGVVRYRPGAGPFEANNRFARMLGYADSAALIEAHERRESHVVQQLDSLFGATQRDGQLDNEQIEFTSATGDAVHTLVSAGTYPLDAGDEQVFEASVVDVSELRRAERERERLREQLQQSQKMDALGTMASGMAHDFNNLLTVILGYADLAQTTLPTEHVARGSLESINTACLRAQELVQRIMTFSRRSGPTRKLIHLSPVVEESLRLLQLTVPSGIELVTRFDAADDLILGDRGQVEQVVINLCQNAVHAMAGNGGRLEIGLHGETTDPDRRPNLGTRRCVVLSVRDSGCGMSAEDLQRIFDPFFTTKAEGQGTGLGLAVVSGIVGHHEGEIDVVSEVGRGTTVTVWWPTAEGVVEDTQPDLKSLPGGNQRLLVVDDETAVRELLDRMLTTLGYAVVACANGQDALETLAERDFDLMISDLRMPGMDGLALIAAARERGLSLPIILLSGTQEDVLLRRAETLGVDRFVAKPVTLSALAERVKEVLDKNTANLSRSSMT